MKRTLSFLLLLFLPVVAWADGVVIPATAFPAKVMIPDQQALICFSNGTERLVIETQFVGDGTNFAWVVPLPAKPVIEEATSGLFTTLEYIFRPAVIHDVAPFYSVLLVCAGIVYLLFAVRRNTPLRAADILTSILVALSLIPLAACIGIPLLFLLPYLVWRVRGGQESPWAIVLVFFLAVIMGSMLLPALGTAGVAVSETGVSILGHEIIGAFETTTITAKEPRALSEWLHDNGYTVPSAADNVISNYVNRGWVFVATKLRRDSAGRAIGVPQPLSFTFHTDKAIYPMQLTRIGNTNLTIDLFVFGPSRADATFFRTHRCSAPIFPNEEYYSRGSTEKLLIVHPLLRKWVAGLPVATELSANLTPEMMVDDIELHWLPFSEIRHDLYSNQGAFISGLNYGVGVFTTILAAASLLVVFKRDWRPRFKTVASVGAIVGVMVAISFFVAAPKTAVRLTRLPVLRSIMDVRELGYSFTESCKTNPVTSLTEARVVLKKIENSYPKLTEQNYLLGGRVREEDSPGNYLLRLGTNGVELVWFDASGGERQLQDR